MSLYPDAGGLFNVNQIKVKGIDLEKRSVCLVVKNRLSNDARVKKEISVLKKDGWQVTVIAMPEQDKPEVETINSVTIIRPPNILFS